MASPFDHPEAQELFETLMRSLGTESDRGVILIGAAHIDECLTSLFQAVFPQSLGKKARERLLGYPGLLSSFSAKIEAAFVLRLIPKRVYDALNVLRQFRNELAHSPDAFDLRKHEQRYRRIYELGPDLPDYVRNWALKSMTDYKRMVAEDTIRKLNEENPDFDPATWTEQDLTDFVSKNPEVKESLEKQLPHWELAMGIALLGSQIVFHRDRASAALAGVEVLGDLDSDNEVKGR